MKRYLMKNIFHEKHFGQAMAMVMAMAMAAAMVMATAIAMPCPGHVAFRPPNLLASRITTKAWLTHNEALAKNNIMDI